jgi:tetratricopeptide (TPR) repeat protein
VTLGFNGAINMKDKYDKYIEISMMFLGISYRQKPEDDIEGGQRAASLASARYANAKFKRISVAFSFITKDPRKTIQLLKGLLEEEPKRIDIIMRNQINIGFALSYDVMGDMKSAYPKWKEAMILPEMARQNLHSEDPFLWAKCALACVEVGQYKEANFACKKAFHWITTHPPSGFSREDVKGINLDNVRIDKDNIRAVSYLILGVWEYHHTKYGGQNRYTGSVQSDNKTDEYLAKSLQLGRGKVKEAAKLQSDKIKGWRIKAALRKQGGG